MTASLRERAESFLATNRDAPPGAWTGDVLALIQELHLHQGELEIQNEELRRAQQESVETRDRYMELYQSVPVGCLTLDDRRTILIANLSAAAMLGRSTAQLIGQPFDLFVAPDDADECYRLLRQATQSAARHRGDIRVKRADGTVLWTDLQALPAKIPGANAALDVTLIDFAARKQIEEHLRESAANMEKANAELETSRRAALNLTEDAIEARREAERTGVALRASEQRIQQALRVSRSFTFDWNPATDRVVRSASCAAILGLSGDEAISDTGQRYFQRVHPEDRERFVHMLRGLTPAACAYTAEYRIARGDGSEAVLDEAGQASFSADGTLERLVGVSTDITARRAAEIALEHRRRREEILAGIASRLLSTDDPQLAVDDLCASVMSFLDCDLFFNFLVDEPTGRLRLNAYGGIAPEEAARIGWLDYGVAVCGCVAQQGRRIIVADIQNTSDPRTALVAGYGVQAYCCHPLLSQGRVLGTLSFGARRRKAFDDDQVSMMAAVAAHVSMAMQRMRDHETLRASEELNRRTLQALPAHIAVVDPVGRIITVNDAWTEFARLNDSGESPTVAVGANYLDVCRRAAAEHDPDAAAALEGIEAVLAGQRRQFSMEYPCHSPREHRWFLMTVAPCTVGGGTGAVITHLNITARKLAEDSLRESELFYRQTLESVPGMTFTTRPDGFCDYQSQQWVDFTGVPMVEHLGDGWNKLLHPDDRPRAYEAWCAAVEGRAPYDLEYRVRRHDGVYEWFKVCARPIRNEAGQIVRWFGTAVNIDSLVKAEEQLKASLTEKEVLLKEVHHRVKNNLQIISSLVSLQIEGVTDPASRGLLGDVRDRVRSMALVHEKLYQSSDLGAIEFAEYARSLLNYLWRAHGHVHAAVSLELDLSPVTLSVQTAVPCGLILNELASNALRHAFRGKPEGVVSVALRSDDAGRVTLRLSDNGVGLPAGADWRQTSSLGLRLVQMLTSQLQGTIEACPAAGGGTAFEIVFQGKEDKE